MGSSMLRVLSFAVLSIIHPDAVPATSTSFSYRHGNAGSRHLERKAQLEPNSRTEIVPQNARRTYPLPEALGVALMGTQDNLTRAGDLQLHPSLLRKEFHDKRVPAFGSTYSDGSPGEPEDQAFAAGGSFVGEEALTAANSSANVSNVEAVREQAVVMESSATLPQWAVIIIASVSTCVMLVVLSKIAACLGSPVPFFGASDVQKLRAEYERSLESTRLLEEALKKKEAEQAERERQERIRRQQEALAVVIGEAQAVGDGGAEGPPASEGGHGEADGSADTADCHQALLPQEAELPPPTKDELFGEMLYRTNEVNLLAGKAGKNMVAQVAPMVAKANQAATVLQTNVDAIKGRVQEMAKKEAIDLVKSVATTMGHDLDESKITENLPDWFNFGNDMGDLDSPPVALLIAGVFAPMQIHALAAAARMDMYWAAVLLAMGALVVILDLEKPCKDWHVQVWMRSFVGLQFFAYISSAIIVAKAGRATAELQEDKEMRQRAAENDSGITTGNAVWDNFFKVQSNASFYFKALFRYDGIIASWPYSFCKSITGIKFIMGIYAWVATYIDLYSDAETHCDKENVVWFLHTYSLIFTLAFLWTVADLVLWIVSLVISSNAMNVKVIEIAKQLDDDMALKMPVFMTLAKAYVFRNSAALCKVKAKVIREDIRKLEAESTNIAKKAKEVEAKLTAIKQEEERVATMQHAREQEEGELIKKYEERLEGTFKMVTPLVALAAANVEGADAPGDKAVQGGLAGLSQLGESASSGLGQVQKSEAMRAVMDQKRAQIKGGLELLQQSEAVHGGLVGLSQLGESASSGLGQVQKSEALQQQVANLSAGLTSLQESETFKRAQAGLAQGSTQVQEPGRFKQVTGATSAASPAAKPPAKRKPSATE